MSAVAKKIGNNISISVLTVKVQEHNRPIQSVGFYVNDEDWKLGWELKEERTFEATLKPSLDISPSDQLTFILHRSYQFGSKSWFKKYDEIRIDASQILDSETGKTTQSQAWQHLVDGTEITVRMTLNVTLKEAPVASTSETLPTLDAEYQKYSPVRLIPTTDHISRICPRFRILLVGKTGVGKSSLINQAFGVDSAHVSEFKPGKADINAEIISKDNPRFVLHDSQGFEPGELINFQRVRDFIQARNRMSELKDKLHAIWICFAIPTAGGRILETGVENLLKLKREGGLGEVPIIIVLTKYDELVGREDRSLDDSHCEGRSDEEIWQLANKKARAALMKECISPLEKSIGTQIPCTAVSTQERYQNTLSDLIQLTFDNVKDHVAKEASIVTAIAQKVNPNVKVEGSIEVGRLKYWSGLASSANFPGKRLLECLDVIHKDIIEVWDFEDPDLNLRSKEFKALMSNMVTDISARTSSHPNRGLGVGFSVVATVAAIVSGLAGPAAPIVIPIAAGLVLAKWLFDVYQNSRQTLERIMAYIIDLTLIMQHVFCLVQSEHSVTSRRIIKLAYSTYDNSSLKSRAHFMITEHVNQTKPLPGSRDVTVDKIVEIIGLFRMDPTEISNLQSRLGQLDLLGGDEPWLTT